MPQVDSIQHLGQVFLPLNIDNNSQPYYFILDTGAGMSAIDQAVAAKLNLNTIGQTELAGTAGVMQVPIKQMDAVAPLRRLQPILQLTQYGLIATVQDLSQFSVPMPNTPEAGLLGNDFLRHFVIEIEFIPPALHISRQYGFLPEGVFANNYIEMWLDNNKIMRVKGRLDDWLDVELRLDSGAATLQGIQGPYLNLPTSTWKQLCEKRPDYNFYTQLSARGMGGQVELNVGRISSLELGPLRFEQPSVVVQPEQGIFASSDAVGFVSLGLFEAGKWITFDYSSNRIYLPLK